MSICIACQLMIGRGLPGCGDHADPLPIEQVPMVLIQETADPS